MKIDFNNYGVIKAAVAQQAPANQSTISIEQMTRAKNNMSYSGLMMILTLVAVGILFAIRKFKNKK